MSLTLSAFIEQAIANPVLIIILLLVLGVTAISGVTDAPNAIATVVSTRCMPPNVAIAVAAVFNLVGLIGMTYISTAVAHTMFGMVNFGTDTHAALLAVLAGMVAAIAWGIFCWFMGIPASKSHMLIAGVTGGAIACSGIAGVVPAEWAKVIYGMVFSLVAGFVLGWAVVKIVEKLFARVSRAKANGFFTIFQDICAVCLSFLHGAQDGQKFLSLAMLAVMLGMYGTSDMQGFPLWLIVLISLAMSLGTAVGGRKIIKSVGVEMVKMEQYQGFAACLSACFCIGLATFTGMPVSTTHTKTTAIMGVGAEKSLRGVKWNLAGRMVLTWVLTFPGCGFLAWAFTYLFLLFM